jgi:FAD synthase
MEVIDLLGRTLFQSTLNSVQPQVKLPDLNNGIYFVKVRFDDNSSAATRMFIQK